MFTISCHDTRRTVEDRQRATGGFLCLKHGKGHTLSNCSRRKLCGKKCPDGSMCRKPHHKLFHEEERLTPLQVAFVQDSSKTILPVISGFIKGKKGDLMETNVFYDSGVQISLI